VLSLKSIKKIVSTMLAILLAVSFLPQLTFAASNPNNIFDDFESYEVGTVPQGYTVDSSDENTKAIASNTEAKDSNNSIYIYDDSSSENALFMRSFGSADALTLEFDYFQDRANATTGNVFGIFGNRYEYIYTLYVRGTGVVTYYNGAVEGSLGGYTLNAGQWHHIKIVATNTDADVYIDDDYLGKIPARSGAPAMKTAIFGNWGGGPVGDAYYIDNLKLTFQDVPDPIPPIFTDKFEEPVDTIGKVPSGYTVGMKDMYEVIPSTNGYRTYDTSPTTGSLGDWTFEGAVVIDGYNYGVGVDLGESMAIDAIRYMNWEAYTSTNTKADFRLYKSDDNVTYTEISDFTLDTFKENGRDIFRFGFEDVTARYVKVSSVLSRTSGYTFRIPRLQEDVVAERKVAYSPGLVVVTGDKAFEGDQSLLLSSGAGGDKAEVSKSFGITTTANLRFKLYPENFDGEFYFGFLNGISKVIEMKLANDGALYFQRGSSWILIADAGVIEANRWNAITVNLPEVAGSGKIELAYVFVNDEYIGSAYYNAVVSGIDSIHFGIDSTEVYIDDVEMSEPDPALTIQRYSTQSVSVYLPEAIESISGHSSDPFPVSGALSFDSVSGLVLSNQVNVGVDLRESQKINAIRLFSQNSTASAKLEDYQLYYSDDNITYTPIPGFLFNSFVDESGKYGHLFEFSGITARYVKVQSRYTGATGQFVVESIRAERKLDKQYRLAGTPGGLTNDASPANGALQAVHKSGVSLSMANDASAGIDFGIVTDVEAVEIWNTDSTPGAEPQDFEVYYAGSAGAYTKIENPMFSTRIEAGKIVYRFLFDSVRAKWIKVHAVSDDGFNIADMLSDIRAYSSVEAVSHYKDDFSPDRGDGGDFTVKKDGTLVMGVTRYKTAGADDFGESDIGAYESSDGGYTWSGPYEFLSNEGLLQLPTFLRMANGDMGMFYLSIEASNHNVCNLYIRRSSDEGATWSGRKRITEAPQGYTINSSGNRVLRLSSGRILMPMSWSKDVAGVYGGYYTYAMIWYSDDDGYTWQRAPGSVNLPDGTLEPTLAELSDGNVYMSIRTREYNSMYKAISTDDGMSWSLPMKYSLNAAGATTTVATLPATGDMLLSWNNAVGVGNNPRNPLTIAVSSDNGETWPVKKNIYEGRLGDQSTYQSAEPVFAFYGRGVYIHHAATVSYRAAMRIIDVDTLYHQTNSSKTIADLPQASTPSAVYDPEDDTLTGVTTDMSYSLDGGKTWSFIGGTTLYLNAGRVSSDLSAENGILIRDNGGYTNAPSDIQSITVKVEADPAAADAAAVAAAKSALAIGYAGSDSSSQVTQNVTLPSAGDDDVAITWASSHPGVVSTAGAVTHTAADVEVTLTATLKKGTAQETKMFTVTVKANKPSDTGTGGTSGTGTDKLQEPGAGTASNGKQVVVTDPKADNGQITVLVKEGVSQVTLPAVPEVTGGTNTLIIEGAGLRVEIPGSTIKQLNALAKTGQGVGAQISFVFEPLSEWEKRQLVQTVESDTGASVNPLGRVYEFALFITESDGSQRKLSVFPQPITVTFEIETNAERIGVYYIGDNARLEYVPSVRDGNKLTAEISHFSKYAVLTYDKTFTDVPAGHWASGAIKMLAAMQLISGKTATTFAPEDNITRAEFAALLSRALGLKATKAAPFTDVKAGSWYAEAVAAVYEAGIIRGRSAKLFAPDATITREEMALMIVRAYEWREKTVVEPGNASFRDESAIAQWAQEAVRKGAAVGLFGGRGNNSFVPKGNLTRAESARLILSLVEKTG